MSRSVKVSVSGSNCEAVELVREIAFRHGLRDHSRMPNAVGFVASLAGRVIEPPVTPRSTETVRRCAFCRIEGDLPPNGRNAKYSALRAGSNFTTAPPA